MKKKSNSQGYEAHLLHALMNNIPDSIYFKDTQSRFIKINKAKAAKFNLKSPEDAVGKTDFDFYPKEFAQLAYDDEQKIMKTGIAVVNKVERIQKPNGTYRWVSATKEPVTGQGGKVIGIVGISRDITPQIEAEERLRAMKDSMEDHVRQKTEELKKTINELKDRLRECQEEEFKLAVKKGKCK